MPNRFSIRRPAAENDRPKPWTVAAVAVTGLLVGWLLVRATLDTEPRDADGERPGGSIGSAEAAREPQGGLEPPVPEPAPDGGGNPQPPEAPVGAVAAAPSEERSAPEPETETERPPAPEDAASTIDEPEPESESAPSGARAPGAGPSDRVVQLGRIAYLRCDGAETGQGPYPCPRDRDLERAAVEIIESLSRCPNAPQGTGEADVRIHFEPGKAPRVLLRGGRSAQRLDGPPVLACLSEPLSRLRTSIVADQLVVSFRFELAAAASD